MEMLPNDLDHPDYQFMVGTNNGIAILKIAKSDFAMTLSKEKYLEGKVVNNFLVRDNKIVAFEYNQMKFRLIDRKTKEVSEVAWLNE